MNINKSGYVNKPLKRQSGILLHPTSLPSPYGIGDLGTEAYQFIDFLARSGQHLWQVLPLTHTGFGDSPYQSFSAFAGQPLLISPEHLIKLHLLLESDLAGCPSGDDTAVDYSAVIPWKDKILRLAYANYRHNPDDLLTAEYHAFCSDNTDWLADYSLFMACKDLHKGRCWLDWEMDYRQPVPLFKKELLERLDTEAGYYKFIQFIFFKEWHDLKDYANDKGIEIIGDIPIFVSLDSADVWMNQHLFQLDSAGYPEEVAGVPPDYFSTTGQLWGNPLYKWTAHQADQYSWWIRRLKNQLNLLDYLRIDHFRGFESYWAVPYGEDTAVNGRWKPAPGKELFCAIQNNLGRNLPIIAEDLGVITPEVEEIRDFFGFAGMKVLQFGFEAVGESSFLPHQFISPNCVCYTGTHDNDTTAGWFETITPQAQDKIRQYMNTDAFAVHWDFIRTCLGTIAAFAVFPLQDVLGIGKTGRMNTPGEAAGNWSWRFRKDALNDGTAVYLKELSQLYGRS